MTTVQISRGVGDPGLGRSGAQSRSRYLGLHDKPWCPEGLHPSLDDLVLHV